MKIHMIGHASIFVETQDSKILVDPVLFSSINHEIETICPQREVIHELIPEFDLLIISHWHSDHYDPRSLASLPKNVDVLIPKDRVLKECLQRLGYSRIYTLADFDEVKIGCTSILTTKSENSVPEFGLIFSDSSGVFWNQVDSVVSFNTISYVKSRYSQIDFLLASWQPMLESQYQYNDTISFPYTAYSKLLTNINMIDPASITPGANGFKKINGASWMNSIVFPVTREQFCKDIKMTCSNIQDNVFELDPGDVLEITNGDFYYQQGVNEFVVKSQDDRAELDFSPVNLDGRLFDYNPDKHSIETIRMEIENNFIPDLSIFILENKKTLFLEHIYWQVIYQLEVVFPDFSLKWTFDFSDENAQFHVGRNPCSNLFTVITASSLYDLIKKLKSCEYIALSGSHRCFQKIYIATLRGVIKPEQKIQDPLILKFPDKDIFEEAQYREVKKWLCKDNDLNRIDSKTSMIKLGNVLIRSSFSNDT